MTSLQKPDHYELHPDLQEVLYELPMDREAKKFLKKTNIFSFCLEVYYIGLRLFGWSHYGAVGNIGYDTFLLQNSFIKKILSQHKNPKTMLDIGAGSGSITKKFISHIPEIYFKEPSKSFTKKLIKLGFQKHEDASRIKYDIITLFNVLDVCDNPKKICQEALLNLSHNGLLLISLPLPIEIMKSYRNIELSSPLQNNLTTFEAAASYFYEFFIMPLGLQVTLLSKIPYMVLSGECPKVKSYTNAIFVCEKK